MRWSLRPGADLLLGKLLRDQRARQGDEAAVTPGAQSPCVGSGQRSPSRRVPVVHVGCAGAQLWWSSELDRLPGKRLGWDSSGSARRTKRRRGGQLRVRRTRHAEGAGRHGVPQPLSSLRRSIAVRRPRPGCRDQVGGVQRVGEVRCRPAARLRIADQTCVQFGDVQRGTCCGRCGGLVRSVGGGTGGEVQASALHSTVTAGRILDVVEALLGGITEVDARTETLWPRPGVFDTGGRTSREVPDHVGVLARTPTGAAVITDTGGVQPQDARHESCHLDQGQVTCRNSWHRQDKSASLLRWSTLHRHQHRDRLCHHHGHAYAAPFTPPETDPPGTWCAAPYREPS